MNRLSLLTAFGIFFVADFALTFDNARACDRMNAHGLPRQEFTPPPDQPRSEAKAEAAGKPAAFAVAVNAAESTEHRQAAVMALTRTGTASVATLAELLHDGNREIPWVAARALGSMGPDAQAAVPALVETLDSPDPRAAGCAAGALQNMGAAAIPALTRILTDKDPLRRGSAAVLLGGVRGQSKVTVPVLDQRACGRRSPRSGGRCTRPGTYGFRRQSRRSGAH